MTSWERERRVVFVDWHNTLSEDLYWASIRHDPSHPVAVALMSACELLFRPASHELDAWLRGDMSSGEIVRMLDIPAFPGIGHADLIEILRSDCLEMRLHPGLTDLLAELDREAMVVLATDNTDAFRLAFFDALAGCGSRSPYTLGACAGMFDDLICSSDIRAVKTDTAGFFGGWLHRRGLGFDDAVLVDDGLPNLEAFRRLGGAGVRWSGPASFPDVASALGAWLEHWVGRGSRGA